MSFIGNAISDVAHAIPNAVGTITGGNSLTQNTAVGPVTPAVAPDLINFQNNAAYQQQLAGTQGSLAAQQGAIGAQQGAIGGQQTLQSQLAAQNAIANQNQVFNQQQQLAQALQAQAAGTGINPVQDQLNQNTAQNVAQQGALMASQRGASSNPALIARLVAEQQAQVQQNSVGQAATLQAQQQLQGQQSLQAQQGLLGNTASGQVGNLLGNQQAIAGNQNAVASNQNALAGNQQNLLNSTTAGIGNYNQAQIGSYGTQAGIQNTLQTGQNTLNSNTSQVVPNLLNSAGAAAAHAGKYQGGEITNPKLAATVPSHRYPANISLPPHLDSVAKIYHGISYDNQLSNPGYPGEKYAYGGDVGSALKSGGKVPGKADVKGDSPKNDIVDAKLSPGEVVLPRSVMQAKDPASAAAEFVRSIQAKKGKSQDPKSDFKKALNEAMSGRKKK